MTRPAPGAKDLIRKILEDQPDDVSFDEVLRHLAFRRIVGRGLRDAEEEKSISTEELRRRFKTWQT